MISPIPYLRKWYCKSNSKATIHLFSDDSKLFFSSKLIEFFIITDEPIN